MESLKIAIVGLGQAAHNTHIPALGSLKDRFKIVAACDPDAVVREKAKASLPAATIYSDLAELLSQETLAAVNICSPPDGHADDVRQALAAGLHVFCEKPVAMSLAEADGMLAASDAAGRVLAVNGQFPDMAIHQAARTEVASPRFG
jgi:predicted dehydrogenase